MEASVSGRDDIGEFYIEELEELEIENTPAPAPRAGDAERLAREAASRAVTSAITKRA